MAENVIVKYGHYEVEPWRMQHYIKQHEMNEAARRKIVKERLMYLDWMHRQEAHRILKGYDMEELHGKLD
jgi:hypothetical protein